MNRDLHAEFFGAEMRTQIRAQLSNVGAPPQFIDVIADVACNAAYEAMTRFEQVLFAYPVPGVQMTASGIGLSLLKHRIEEVQAAVEDIADQSGAVTTRATLKVRR